MTAHQCLSSTTQRTAELKAAGSLVQRWMAKKKDDAALQKLSDFIGGLMSSSSSSSSSPQYCTYRFFKAKPPLAIFVAKYEWRVPRAWAEPNTTPTPNSLATTSRGLLCSPQPHAFHAVCDMRFPADLSFLYESRYDLAGNPRDDPILLTRDRALVQPASSPGIHEIRGVQFSGFFGAMGLLWSGFLTSDCQGAAIFVALARPVVPKFLAPPRDAVPSASDAVCATQSQTPHSVPTTDGYVVIIEAMTTRMMDRMMDRMDRMFDRIEAQFDRIEARMLKRSDLQSMHRYLRYTPSY
jgi:hypothetical protein